MITAKNASSTIEACVESVLNAKYPAERFEVIYVDAESTDDTLEKVEPLARKYTNFRYVVEPGLPGKGRNRGIRESRGDIIAFTDADCVVQKWWIETITSHFDSETDSVVGVGGPSITHPSEANFGGYVGRLWETRFGSGGLRNPASYVGSRFVDHNPTCNAAYRRWIFDEVGLFEEALPATEDEEFDTRIRRSGYRLLYADDVVVWHRRRATLESFAKQMHSYGFWRAHSGKTQRVPLKFIHFAPSILLLYVALLPALTMIFGLPSAVPLVVYFGLGMVSGMVVSAKHREPSLTLIIPLLGFLEHTAYGLGFIRGLIPTKE